MRGEFWTALSLSMSAVVVSENAIRYNRGIFSLVPRVDVMRCRLIVAGLVALVISRAVCADEDVSLRSVKDGIVTVDLDEQYSQVCAGARAGI